MSDLSIADIKQMKVDALKKELTARGLSVNGKKAELLQRLENALLEVNTSDVVTEDDLLNESLVTPVIEIKEPTSEPEKKIVSTVSSANLSEEELQKQRNAKFSEKENDVKQQRAERFGIKTDEDLKAQRAARFGAQTTDVVSAEDDAAKRAARAIRFGIDATTDSGSTKNASEKGSAATSEDQDKKLARAKRFGSQGLGKLFPVDAETLAKRAKRFGLPSEDFEVKQKRAERFALST